MKSMSLRAQVPGTARHRSCREHAGARRQGRCAKQSPAKRAKPFEQFRSLNWRLLRREKRPPRNDIILLIALLIVSCTPAGGINQVPVVAPIAVTPDGAPLEETQIPTPEPFRLTLPTPGSEPISGWRPPLYPVPWAMSPYDHFYFVRPIAADQVNWPLANYRYGGIFFAPNIVHTGVDIDAPEGSPVFAAGPGTVVWAGWGLFTEAPDNLSDPYGLAVAIQHDFGFQEQQLYTVYAHMSKITTVLGQHVNTGDQIGLVGSTGATTGPHLHFEVRFPNNSFDDTYNPELWIAPPQGWGVLVGRVMDTRGLTIEHLEVAVKSEETGITRVVKSYGGAPTNSDPYYKENVVLGDLPAGIYKITLHYEDERNPLKDKDPQTWVEIYPGQVTYFTFKGNLGYRLSRPPAPTLDFLPTVVSTASTPTP